MPKETLKSTVNELRSQLEGDESVEEPNKEALQALANRIDAMMSGDGEHWEEELIEALDKQLIIYEENHPALTTTIQNVLSAIAGLGV